MARLWERYKTEIHGQLKDQLGLANPMSVPRLDKVVVSVGTGSPTASAENKNRLATVMEDLGKITGQKPQVRRARVSVSNFKLRRGMEIGARVTLRGVRMYEFLDRLINLAIPRLRDFRGLNPRSFDGRGNFSMGLPDQLCFPEIDATKVTFNQGMNITFVTSTDQDAQARELLAALGIPFRRQESKQ
jgi:large subunit ribosomal protein L5